MSPASFSYADLLARQAVVHAGDLAFTGAFEPVTHETLHRRCRRLAAGWAKAGLAPGDRLAILSGNRVELFEALGAAAMCGATLVLLNTRASAAEIAAVVEDAEPRWLLVDPALQVLAEAAGPAVPRVVLGRSEWQAWQVLKAGDAATLPARPSVDAGAPLVGIPTAAVEGRPRVAMLSHAALMHQALALAQAWHLGPADRHLGVLPMFHVAGLGLALAAQLAGGATVLMERFDATSAVEAIERWKVGFFATFAPILGSVLDAAQASGSTLASLRAVTGLESPDTVARLRSQCPDAVFWSGYGQTETAGLVCLSPATERPGSAGRPLPTVALRIAGPDGRPAAAGESGEIHVRGPFVFSGYWRRPAASAQAVADGWHRTGDLGRVDADGYLWFEGRAPDKALIKSGGENIYPAEVEEALQAHPAIAAAVVFGVPDARWGEAVRAVCACRPGQQVEAEALAEFVAARIARFKRPRDIVFVDTLPRAPDGQWDRVAIAARHGAGPASSGQ